MNIHQKHFHKIDIMYDKVNDSLSSISSLIFFICKFKRTESQGEQKVKISLMLFNVILTESQPKSDIFCYNLVNMTSN